jgi:tetratricopeptide (TPR) repeat protein
MLGFTPRMLRQRPIPSAATVPAKSPGRRSGTAVGLLLATTALAAPQVRAAGCTLTPVAELPVTMIGTTPSVHAKINGRDALFIADSGAFYNTLTPAAAADFNLHHVTPGEDYIEGFGGSARAYVTQVDTFTIFNIPVPKVAFVVAGNDLPGGAVGLLGQNIFHIGDVEYDLANGMIRIMRTQDCMGKALAYWSAGTQKPYSVIDIELSTMHEPHTKSVAYLNGQKLKVMFDTGSSRSLLTLSAARRAGINPDSPGVVPSGYASGIGRSTVKTWIARFASFKIGDEEIHNARLRFADTDALNTDMLIGADFFLSHRIYVASSQKKLYFTYNGGPVFNLETESAAVPEESATPAAGAATAAESPAAETATAAARLDEPTDAAGFARRAAAWSARKMYAQAVADLDRACELAPTDASYLYQRGMAHWFNREPNLARTDFDLALKLKPDDPDALVERASLGVFLHESPEMLATERETADRTLRNDSDARWTLGQLYANAGQFPEAVLQYTKWIDSNAQGNKEMSSFLNSRCWIRAQWGHELDEALQDCNGALKLRPDSAAYLDSRGLVYLRKGDFKSSIADYDSVLRKQQIPWSLYGRGIARLRTGDTARGNADIAAATALDKNIGAKAAKEGITP